MSNKSYGMQTDPIPQKPVENSKPKPRGSVVTDPVLICMNRISKILSTLTPAQQRRVVAYFYEDLLPASPMPNLTEKPA